MIDLTEKALPNTIKVKGVPFSINTDFRIWIKYFNILKNMKEDDQVDVSFIFKNDHPATCNIMDFLDFANPKCELPRSMGDNSDIIVIDYELDGDLIYSAFLGQYGIDLVDIDHLHWHKFLALIKGLNDSTKLKEVMGYRCYKKTNKTNEDQMERLKAAWAIFGRSEYSDEELEEFSDLFN